MFCRAMGAPRRRHPKIWLYIVTALALWPYPIHAHDIYTDLVDANGYSCCNGIDCHPVSYRRTTRGVQMLVDNHWIDIPETTIQYRALLGDDGETGGGHWCGEHADFDWYYTRCAILPPNSALLTGR
jgi:hypothetical protein